MQRRSFTGVVVIAVLALAALAPTAAADQPVTTITTIDRTFTLPASPNFCPFPFIVHSQGAIRETVYSNGKDAKHAKGHIGLQHGLGNKDAAGVANDKGVVKFRKVEIKAL